MAINLVQAVINGQTYTLTYNGTSGKYEATITAPTVTSFNLAGGHYGVVVKATDVAGNLTQKDDTDATLGASLQLVVKENVAPTIAITSPGSGARITTAAPSITGQLRDETNGSGIKDTTFALKIDSGAAVIKGNAALTLTPVTGGFNFTYAASGLANGTHTITVDVQDNDGNVATKVISSFTIDTIAPTLNVTAPTDTLITNQVTCTVTGTTSDATSSPVVITVKLNNVAQSAVIVTAGSFTKAVTLTSGVNTIAVTATDAAGLTTTVNRTVTLDQVAPVITLVELVPNPVDAGATLIIKVTVTDS